MDRSKCRFIFLLLGIIGILMILIAGVNIVSNIGINKYLKNSAYGIDYQKEISTYKIIGKNKKKIKMGLWNLKNIVLGKNISRKSLRRLLIMKMRIVLWLEDLEIKKVIKN